MFIVKSCYFPHSPPPSLHGLPSFQSDIGMTTLVFGVGVGLFLILCLWALAGLVFVVSLKIERKVGAIAILVVGICTIVLISVPRASEKPLLVEDKVYDRSFLRRVLLLVLLGVSSVVGLAGYVKYELADTVKPVRITKWAF